MAQRGLRVGLTGGIGSGKSTAAGTLVKLGAVLIDTDAISRTLTAPGGAAIGALRAAFGADVIDAHGALERNRMRTLAFTNATAKARLESILHPLIAIETQRQADAAGCQAVIFDVPLLVESGRWRGAVDRVLVIDCSEPTQVQRVLLRPGWSRDAASAVIAQQAGRAQRRAAADAVICNDGLTLNQLADEVQALWRRWHPVEQSAPPSAP